jgi:hypothetical protein
MLLAVGNASPISYISHLLLPEHSHKMPSLF